MKLSHRTIARAVTTAVACTASVALAASAQAAVPEAQTSAGALSTYLAANGDHFHTTYDGTDYADYGLTLDGVLALDSAGVGSTESTAALSFVERPPRRLHRRRRHHGVRRSHRQGVAGGRGQPPR